MLISHKPLTKTQGQRRKKSKDKGLVGLRELLIVERRLITHKDIIYII
jgi:hypothetical protein